MDHISVPEPGVVGQMKTKTNKSLLATGQQKPILVTTDFWRRTLERNSITFFRTEVDVLPPDDATGLRRDDVIADADRWF